MAKTSNGNDETINLLRFIVAIELWKSGVSQADIARRLGIATASVNKYVKGLKKNPETQ